MDGNLPPTKPKLRVAVERGWGEGGGRGQLSRTLFLFVHPIPTQPPPGIRERTGWRSLALGFHRKLNQLPSLITNPRFLIKGSLIKGRAQLCQCSDPAQGGLGASEEPTLVLLREGEMDRLPAAGWGGGVVLQDSRCDAGMVSPCRGSMSPGPAGKTLESPGHLTEEPRRPRASGSSRLQGNLNAGPRAPGDRVRPAPLLKAAASPGSHWHPHPAWSFMPTAPCRAPGRVPLHPLIVPCPSGLLMLSWP